ncbi:MAG: hydrogenase maturation nickel metallochaperone HypA, partial [Enterobacteriaceae bacterium]
LFGLEIASRETVAEGAQYHIRIQPAQGWCLACNKPFTVAEYASPCPHCGSWQIQVESGKEMRICELEVI